MSMFEAEGRDKWLSERFGKFTASMIGKLMISGKKPGEMFSAGAYTYIRQVAVEKLTEIWDRPELEFVPSLFHGKAYEEPAFEHYRKVTKNYSMRYFGSGDPLFLEYGEDAGGSPDALMGEGELVHLGAEIKCPKNPGVHFDYLQMKSQWDLKEYNGDYYAQIQFLMLITKAPAWHFFSYHELFKSAAHKYKVIEVFPDTKFQNELEVRLKQAIKERNKIIASLS